MASTSLGGYHSVACMIKIGFSPSLAHHSAHVQGHSWMSSNQFAPSMDVPPSHLPSEANAPPIHTSADRTAPKPHLAVLSLPSSSPGPTRKLLMEKVYFTLCLPSIDGTAKVQVFDPLESRFTFVTLDALHVTSSSTPVDQLPKPSPIDTASPQPHLGVR